MKHRIQETTRCRNNRYLKKNVYISCEGNTEEAYLWGLKNKYSDKAIIKISNSNKTSAKDVVLNLRSKYKSEYSRDDLKYCIFDCDENSVSSLNEAKHLADKERAQIIFSNPCFEIWLLWHFEANFSYQDNRENLKRKIEDLIRPEYWKCKHNPNLFELLENNISEAQLNYLQRKQELEQDNIPEYSRESNPYSNIDILISKLIEITEN